MLPEFSTSPRGKARGSGHGLCFHQKSPAGQTQADAAAVGAPSVDEHLLSDVLEEIEAEAVEELLRLEI